MKKSTQYVFWWCNQNLVGYLIKILHSMLYINWEYIYIRGRYLLANMTLQSQPTFSTDFSCKRHVRQHLKYDFAILLPKQPEKWSRYCDILLIFVVFSRHCLIKLSNPHSNWCFWEGSSHIEMKKREGVWTMLIPAIVYFSTKYLNKTDFIHVSNVSIRVLVRVPTRSVLLIWWTQLQKDSTW